jgi:hypothetical protein
VVPASPADVDDTGAVVQALAAAGRRGGAAVRAGVAFLRGAQGSDGGWGQLLGRDSNSQSTSWAVQGLVAARVPLGSLSADPLAYLRGLQRGDGHVAYSRTSDQTPVWATAQAVAALERKPFPLARVARGRTSMAAASPSAGSEDGGHGDGGGSEVVLWIAVGVALAAGLGWGARHRHVAA